MCGRCLRIGLVMAVGMLAGVLSQRAMAGTKLYTFTNDTGQAANDLHIEFTQGVSWSPDPPPPFTTSSGSGSSTFNASGGTVANGAPMPGVSFHTTGTGPTIKKGWWTKDGTNIGALTADNTNPWP
jgi:hypothetical protein